jgi:hypothetical protein
VKRADCVDGEPRGGPAGLREPHEEDLHPVLVVGGMYPDVDAVGELIGAEIDDVASCRIRS